MIDSTDLIISTYAERPEFIEGAYSMPALWPDFMRYDRVASALLLPVISTFPHLNVLATIDGVQVARGMAIPFALRRDGEVGKDDVTGGPRSGRLPSDGWDRVLIWAWRDHGNGADTDTVSALEITVHADHTGSGLSGMLLTAMREAAAAAGYGELVAPVRPYEKHLQPRLPMREYITQRRDDGLPTDLWLRQHVRAGALVDSVAPTSMTIIGTLNDWRTWTGLPFNQPRDVEVPGALAPVVCVPDQDYAVYVEPNVWVRHQLTGK